MSVNQHFGSPFEDFLKEEGIYDEATAHAIKRVITWQIEKAMKAEAEKAAVPNK
jgi:antitoxin HicB